MEDIRKFVAIIRFISMLTDAYTIAQAVKVNEDGLVTTGEDGYTDPSAMLMLRP